LPRVQSAKEKAHFHMDTGFAASSFYIALLIVLGILVFALRRKED